MSGSWLVLYININIWIIPLCPKCLPSALCRVDTVCVGVVSLFREDESCFWLQHFVCHFFLHVSELFGSSPNLSARRLPLGPACLQSDWFQSKVAPLSPRLAEIWLVTVRSWRHLRAVGGTVATRLAWQGACQCRKQTSSEERAHRIQKATNQRGDWSGFCV